MLFADLLSLHLVTFLMFSILFLSKYFELMINTIFLYLCIGDESQSVGGALDSMKAYGIQVQKIH